MRIAHLDELDLAFEREIRDRRLERGRRMMRRAELRQREQRRERRARQDLAAHVLPRRRSARAESGTKIRPEKGMLGALRRAQHEPRCSLATGKERRWRTWRFSVLESWAFRWRAGSRGKA